MTDQPQIVTVEPTTTAVVRGEVPVTELESFFDRSFGLLTPVLERQGIAPTGPAFAYYLRHPTETMHLEVGFPVDRAVTADGDVIAGSLPGGRVARTVHAGSFDGLSAAWEALADWALEQGAVDGPDAFGSSFWEVYLTEPSPDMDPADLRTELNLPLP